MDEEYIIHGPQRLKPLTKNSIGQQLYNGLKENIKVPVAFVDPVTDKRISFKMLLKQSYRLAESLKAFGFTQNDVIAVCSENSVDFIILVLAALYLGITITTFNPGCTIREILHGANISKPAGIFCSKMTVNTILEVTKELKTVRKIIVMETDEKHEDWESLQDFTINYSSPHLDVMKFIQFPLTTIEQVAFILYSSGLPKGIMLSNVAGQIGHIIMKGYAGNSDATKKAIDANGWLATGDVRYYDQDGFFYIVDRLEDLIKYKGFQVPPADLEAILLTHPKIEDAGVVGLPDEVAGELPLAFVVTKSNQRLTEEQVIDFIAKHISPQKQLHGGVRFIAEIPRTPSGKILRKELRKLLQTHKSKL